jgi:predicted kinase
MLIVFGGLPGVGKTTIARALAQRLGAVHVCIDSIEQAIAESGVTVVSLDDAGYRVGYKVAEDNLRLGLIVIADSVNPIPATRDSWRAAATRARVIAADVEVRCSDEQEHRRRVEERLRRPPARSGPSWEAVVSRDYRRWDSPIVIDTAGRTIEESVAELHAALAQQAPDKPGIRHN